MVMLGFKNIFLNKWHFIYFSISFKVIKNLKICDFYTIFTLKICTIFIQTKKCAFFYLVLEVYKKRNKIQRAVIFFSIRNETNSK